MLVQSLAKKRNLVLVSGFIHDVTSFMDHHPGGRHLMLKNIGRDATAAFWGGIYDHSNAAHNVSPVYRSLLGFSSRILFQLLAMMRVGVLRGGLEIESEKAVPPSQKLRVVSHAEMIALSSLGGIYGNGRVDQAVIRPDSPLTSELGSDSGLVFGVSSADEDEPPKTPVSEVGLIPEIPVTK